jgi:hypothetical protein
MGYKEWKSCIDACLQCAAVCNYCASSCTKEEDVKMMAKCIELDMQCAAICCVSVQLMSMGSKYAKQQCVEFVQSYVKHVEMSAANTIMSIAENVAGYAKRAPKNAARWLLNFHIL